jgi:hypothetical protein
MIVNVKPCCWGVLGLSKSYLKAKDYLAIIFNFKNRRIGK